jgi:hypothetical protein
MNFGTDAKILLFLLKFFLRFVFVVFFNQMVKYNKQIVWFATSQGLRYKIFLRLHFTVVYKKLECLSLEGLSSVVSCVWVRPGAKPRVEHLKGDHLDRFQPYYHTLD